MPDENTAETLPIVLPPVLPRPVEEFAIEGELSLAFCGGVASFRIDDCELAAFVRRHFSARYSEYVCALGQCKVLIIPIHE